MHDFPSFVDLLRERAAAHPDRLAFSFLQDGETETDRWTFAELDRRARAIAASLLERGLSKQRALLLYNPSLEFVSSFFGCLYANVIAVPAYPPRSSQLVTRLNLIIRDAQASIALTTSSLRDSIGKHLSGDDSPNIDCIATDNIALERANQWSYQNINPRDLAFLQYTSGSTGSPKGVMVGHGNLVSNTEFINQCFGVEAGATAVSWLPPYHDMGLVGGILQPLFIGASMVLMPPVAFLQRPFRWLSAISRFKAAASGGPNFAYDLCSKQIKPQQIEELNLENWSLAFSGAEPVRSQTIDNFSETFSQCGFQKQAFLPCYGLAENTLIVTGGSRSSLPVVRHFDTESLSKNIAVEVSQNSDASVSSLVGSGVPVSDQVVVVADPESCKLLKDCQIGEVWISGDSVAQGYWKKDELSLSTFKGNLEGSQKSYLRTGDLGFFHQGELFITGRRKDLIIVRGQNHYPQDLEATTQASHPSLRIGCGAAFSVEDSVQGEQLVIVQEVERSALRCLDASSIVSAIREAVVSTHNLLPSAIILLKTGSIPKTSSGKIQRFACRQKFLAGELNVVGSWDRSSNKSQAVNAQNKIASTGTGRVESLVDAGSQLFSADERRLHDWFINYLSVNLGIEPDQIDIDQPLASFGLDSLAAVRLTADLQDWMTENLAMSSSTSISPTLAYDYPTITKIAKYLLNDELSEDSEETTSAPINSDEPIAVVGVGCRFPGASSPQSFWELLNNGVSAVVNSSDGECCHASERFSVQSASQFGGYLENVDRFDSGFFRIASKEADQMDPQQRILLETSWEAFENASIVPDSWSGTRSGVFVGISSSDYSQLNNQGSSTVYTGTGNAHSVAANRLSYLYDLRGPSMAVDTACSSSLVAIHLACRSISSGECDQAIAAGVNVLLSSELTNTFQQAGMLSPDGVCKAFDEAANGYVRGEGCGVLLLKRLSEAVNDSDNILGVISGSAITQDGRSNGLTAPNGDAQKRVVRNALSQAGIKPEMISYVEAHGTGTSLGDPIEINALRQIFTDNVVSQSPCWVGSVKTNIGHLEAAAGIAGVIKTLLAIQHNAIPPNLNFNSLNPLISLNGSRISLPTESVPWPDETKHAGVSSFGFGGTNAHLILSSPPQKLVSSHPETVQLTDRSVHLLTLTARTKEALDQLRLRYADLAAAAVKGLSDVRLSDLCYSVNTGRALLPYRFAWVGSSFSELEKDLVDLQSDQHHVFQGESPLVLPSIAFLFTGQGAQYVGMGKELYNTQAPFKNVIDSADAFLNQSTHGEALGMSLQELIFGESGHQLNDEADSALHQTRYSQVGLFALEVGLCRLWQSWGVHPDWLMGHSVGELAAACIAGVFSFEDGLRLVSARARLMSTVQTQGGMLSVFAETEDVLSVVHQHSLDLVVAAFNGPTHCVLSGDINSIEKLADLLDDQGIVCRKLRVSHAFHSPLMKEMIEEFAVVARTIQYHQPSIPLVSNITHSQIGEEIATADYWCSHVLEPVHFSQSVQYLVDQGVQTFIEVGPSPTLLKMAQSCVLSESSTESTLNTRLLWLSSLHPRRCGTTQILESLATLHCGGYSIDWSAFDQSFLRRRVPLPTYPWQRRRHWLNRPDDHSSAISEVVDTNTGQVQLVEWHQSDSDPVLNSGGRSAGCWVLLASEAWAAAFAEHLPTDQTCLIVSHSYSSSLQQKSDHHWELDTNEHHHWEQLFSSLCSDLARPILGIIDVQEASYYSEDQEILSSVRSSRCHLALSKALISIRSSQFSPRLWMISACHRDDSFGQALQQGFARSLTIEHPDLLAGIINLPNSQTSEAQRQLQCEIQQPQGGPANELQILLEGGHRSVARLVPSQQLHQLLAGQIAPLSESLTHQDGVVLITGGLGAIGQQLAQNLIEQGVRSLILVSRGDGDSETRQRLERWRLEGLRVDVINGDIANSEIISRINSFLEQSNQTLSGIIHAAGVLMDGAVHSIGREEWDSVIRPKLIGAWHLHQLSLNNPVDFFILFSSASAVLGSPGQSHYAAANAALDTFAVKRTKLGLPALSIQWGPWAQTGMAAQSEKKDALEAAGLEAFTPAEALSLFSQFLRLLIADPSCLPPVVSAIRADWERLLKTLGARSQKSFLEAFQHRKGASELATVPYKSSTATASTRHATDKQGLLKLSLDQRVAFFSDYLISTLNELIDHSDELVTLETHLMDSGVDSLMVMDAISRIQQDFDLMVYPREVYQYPRIDDLSHYLASEFQRIHCAEIQDISLVRPSTQSGLYSADRWWSAFKPPVVLEKKLPKACFILSSPRSGSTLLRVMLAGHPQLLSPPELHLLPFSTMRERKEDLEHSHLGEGLQRLLMDIDSLSPSESQNLVEQWESESLPISDVYRYIQSKLSGKVLVDKSPSYAMNLSVLNQLDGLFEEVRVVHLIRNPIPVIESFVKMRMDKLLGFADQNPYELAEEIWKNSNSNIEFLGQQLGHHQFMSLRYEDLVTSPESSLRPLCEFLDIPFDKQLLNPYQGERLTDGLHQQSMGVGDPNFLQHSAIDPSLAANWNSNDLRHQLSPETIELANSYGYSLKSQSTNPIIPPISVPDPAHLVRRSFTYQGISGLELHGCEWGPSSGIPVVCLHGILDQSLIWETVAQPLASAGLRLIAPDLRGHGLSASTNDLGSYQLIDFISDITSLFEQRIDQPAVLVGHSFGSVLAGVVANLKSNQVRHLLLVEPVLPSMSDESDSLSTIQTLLDYRKSNPQHPIMSSLSEAVAKLKKVMPRLSDQFATELATRGTCAVNEGYMWRWDPVLKSRTCLNLQAGPVNRSAYTHLLANTSCSITSIYGKDSLFNRPEDLEELHLSLKGARRLVVDGGHHLTVDSPSSIVADVLDALGLSDSKRSDRNLVASQQRQL